MKVIFLNCTNLDFESNGDRIKGTQLKFIEKQIKNDTVSYVPGKQWIKAEAIELVKKANSLIPGQVVNLEYSLDGKNVIFTGINPTDDVAVDFDKIFKERS